jgi:transposase
MTQISTKENLEYIGVDIAKKKYDVCYNNNAKKIFSNDALGHKQFIKTLPHPDKVIVTMEPTGGYEKSLIYALHDSQYNVVLANSYKVKSYGSVLGFLAKNDKIDSYIIKSFAADIFPKGKLNILSVKSTSFKKLESWLTRSRQVVKMLASEKQRYEKTFDKDVMESCKKSITFHEKELILIENKIKAINDNVELLERAKKYKQIPGIGNICANALTIYLPELGSYPNKVISAIVGTAPYCRESGKYKGKSIIRGGRNKLRSILYMGILTAMQHNKIIKKFYDRLIQKGKHHNVAMIACMRKMLCIINAMERNNTQWDENYCSNKL